MSERFILVFWKHPRDAIFVDPRNICDMTHSYVCHDLFICPRGSSCYSENALEVPFSWIPWVFSHIWMSHATHINQSCHTYEWVMPHVKIGRVTHMNASCHTYESVVSHIWMSHATHMNQSCHTYECVIHMCAMTHSYAWHVWLIRTCDMTYAYVCPNSSMYVTWLMDMSAVTFSCVFHDSYVVLTWLMCAMTNSFASYDTFVLSLYKKSSNVLEKKIWRFIESAGT